jgi:hypothetical protein
METISLLHKSREEKFKAAVDSQVSEKIANVDFDDVNRLEFSSGISLKSLLWAVAFFIFFLDLCLRRNPDNWFFSSIAAMSVGFGILAIILADRQYYILLYMNDGSKTKVGVAKNNRKDAEEFVALANGQI